jgi:hypothetical protein
MTQQPEDPKVAARLERLRRQAALPDVLAQAVVDEIGYHLFSVTVWGRKKSQPEGCEVSRTYAFPAPSDEFAARQAIARFCREIGTDDGRLH